MYRILLIKRGAIGDLLLATPLIRQLKQKVNCSLDLIVGKAAAVAIKDNRFLDNITIVEDSLFNLASSHKLARLLLSLRGKYDYVFILDKHWYFNLQARLVGAKTIGYSRDNFSRLLLDFAVSYYDINRYHGLYYLDLLTVSGLAETDYKDLSLDLEISESDKSLIYAELAKYDLDKFVIVVNSGGNNSHEQGGIRMLPEVKILALLDHLLIAGKSIILLGGAVDKENYATYCSKLSTPERLFNWAGKFSLSQSAFLVSLCDKFFTTDCGAMHLGVAMCLETRMLAFFGPTNPAHILPQAYLRKSALWFDEDIYNPDYQLKGTMPRQEGVFFDKIDINDSLSRLYATEGS